MPGLSAASVQSFCKTKQLRNGDEAYVSFVQTQKTQSL